MLFVHWIPYLDVCVYCTEVIKKIWKDKDLFHKTILICKKTKLKNPEQKHETFNVPENQCQLLQLINYSPWKKKWNVKKIERHWSTLQHSILYNLGTRYPILLHDVYIIY